jgi:DNA polymerase-3 subunit epsilon
MGRIIEIGIVKLNLETEQTQILFDSLVKEKEYSEIDKGAWIFENSDLIYEDIMDAPYLNEFVAELQQIFNNYRITAFNKSFDIGWMKSRGFKFPSELSCIMLTATPICRIPKPWDDPNDPYKWPSVQEAWDFFYPNIKYIELHRAADDAVHEAMILLAMYKRGFFPI